VLVVNYGFHQVHLYVGRISRLLHERIPKAPFPKQACVRLFFSMSFFHSRHTQCRLIGSLQFALPFLLAFLAGRAVDAYHFHWVVLPGSAFFGMSCVFSVLYDCVANITHSYLFITQALLALLCGSGKFHARQWPLLHECIFSLLTILFLKYTAVPNTRRRHGSRARHDLFAYRHRVYAPLQETEGVCYGDRTERSFSWCNCISTW
jgi:hypothetical protein